MSTAPLDTSPGHPEAARTEPETIRIESLSVEYPLREGGFVRALDDVSLVIQRTERLVLIGESGSGKSTLGLTLSGLLPRRAVTRGKVTMGDTDVLAASDMDLRALRGAVIGSVFQDASVSLDPLRTVGAQVADSFRAHRLGSAAMGRRRAQQLLNDVGIADAEHRLRQFPHELSGGMRQRALIASGLSGRPDYLLADEPTSALDVTTQARVLDLLKELGTGAGLGVVLITHDLGLASGFADKVGVMYAGELIEYGSTEDVIARPSHPYTALLLESYPRLRGPRQHRFATIEGFAPYGAADQPGCRFVDRCPVGQGRTECRTIKPAQTELDDGRTVRCHLPFSMMDRAVEGIQADRSGLPAAPRTEVTEILVCDEVTKVFGTRRRFGRATGVAPAVEGVSLRLLQGQNLGVVGESGSGKSTLARMIVGLERPTSGSITVLGDKIDRARHRLRHSANLGAVQLVFQDPGGSLDPLQSLLTVVSEPLVAKHGGRPRDYGAQVSELLERVGLPTDWLGRRSGELSGGQRQRVAIARAVAARPAIVVADEAVSALDVSVRGQVLNLLADLQDEIGFSCVHVSHDLSLVRHVCDHVVVMRAGHIVEQGAVEEVFGNPRTPYTRELIDAVPDLATELTSEPNPVTGQDEEGCRP